MYFCSSSFACHLKDKAHKIYIGSALAAYHLTGDSQYKTIAAQEFNSLTPENEMKWSSIENTRGQKNYKEADQLVEFAEQHGMKVRGHNLIWHEQVPQWINQLNKTALEQVMNAHIK